MKSKNVITLFTFNIFLGICLSASSFSRGMTNQSTPAYLSDKARILSAIQKFYATRDLTTEEGKIDYLLERIRNSKLAFIRNGMQTSGSDAAAFMRWKIGWYENRYHVKIKTAQDFVSLVTSGSKKTGKPYTIILGDGSRHNAQIIIQSELDALESCLKQACYETGKAA